MARRNDYTRQIDKYIGKRIYDLRLAIGFSREQLSKEIGVTHQQLQKYETGANRVTVSRLMLIAKALSKDVSDFYEGFKEGDQTPRVTQSQRMCLEISKNFMKITKPEHQNAVHTLVKSLVKAA